MATYKIRHSANFGSNTAILRSGQYPYILTHEQRETQQLNNLQVAQVLGKR